MAYWSRTRSAGWFPTIDPKFVMPASVKPGEVDLPVADRANVRRQSGTPIRILAADDQEHILEALDLLLHPQGYRVDKVRSPVLVREALASNSYDAILIDLNYTRDTTSGQEGLDLLSQIVALDSTVPVIVMTAWANVELAVEAMRRGARDFVEKPWENERLISILRTQVELHHALQQAARLEAENRLLRAEGRPEFIAAAPAMRPVLDTIARVGPSDANVLIAGEHGTGKEVVAQTLHALSARASRPLVAVNTGAIPDGVFESELFGHVKGAFTDARMDRIGRFELADGGTIFLDEIGNVPLRQQAKLLRVLESGEIERVGSSRPRRVDVRVLSATNTDLPAACAGGQFREDLLFRLNTVEIHVPALRERREDIPVLAGHFLARYASRYRRSVQSFEAAAMQALQQYAWPGNVRELEHTIERAVLMCRGQEIQPADLSLSAQRVQSQNLEELSLEAVEAVLVRKALQRFQGNVSQAAEALGLSRGALYRRMEKYGV
jgi:DNA-binding NtrC family response regulator